VHPEIKTTGNTFILDSSDIAAIIQTWNPNKPAYLPLLLDPEDTAAGFSLRLCVELGYRLLCVITPTESRKWFQTNWMALLVKNLTISQEQVFTIERR
jgi:hypothetical protein